MTTLREASLQSGSFLSEFEVAELSNLCAATIALNPALGARSLELHDELRQSLHLAKGFAQAVSDPLSPLLGSIMGQMRESLRRLSKWPVLVVGNSGLPCLALVGQFLADFGAVTVEDCAFARDYMSQFVGIFTHRLHFASVSQLIKETRQRSLGTPPAGPHLFLSISDRWATKGNGMDLVCELGGSKFSISPADAILSLILQEAYLLKGASLEKLNSGPQELRKEIPAPDVRHRSINLMQGLSHMLSEHPHEYFGSKALISRSLRWRRDEAKETREILRAVLRYCVRNRRLATPELAKELRVLLTS